MTYRIALIGLLMGGCYAGYGQQQQTLPEPVQVAGPPGGQIDQGYGQYPDQPGDPQGYQQGDPSLGFQGDPNIQQDPNDPNAQPADPQQEAAPMADVQDIEIDATLQGYGTWEQDDDYGRVWRPDVTIVGADFTPYDSDGSWAYTEYGWTFNCDYGWGWLPFHYGRWGWIGNGWGWVPGNQWGPGWVDWRHGGGLVGWRPTLPEYGGHGGGDPLVRDHRHGAQALDSHWHFQNEGDLGRGHIRGRELNNPAEGLRVTAPVQRPPLRGTNPVHVASIMGTRHATGVNTMSGGTRTNPQAFRQPAVRQPQQAYRQPTYRQPTYRQPTYQQPTYRQPAVRQPYPQQPAYRQPTYTQRPTYQQPRPTYTQRPTYQQPQRPTYQQPQRPTYQQPQRSTFQPARPSYSAPSHFSPSSSAPSHSSPAPSHSSWSPSHSSGGGGRHR